MLINVYYICAQKPRRDLRALVEKDCLHTRWTRPRRHYQLTRSRTSGKQEQRKTTKNDWKRKNNNCGIYRLFFSFKKLQLWKLCTREPQASTVNKRRTRNQTESKNTASFYCKWSNFGTVFASWWWHVRNFMSYVGSKRTEIHRNMIFFGRGIILALRLYSHIPIYSSEITVDKLRLLTMIQ